MNANKNTLALTLLSLSASVLAQTSSSVEKVDSFGGSLTARVTQTDNTLKVEESALSERQDELSGTVFANYENSTVRFNADYAVNYTNYSKDSQENRSFLEGQTQFQIGKEKDLFDILLSQSQRTQYSSPDDVALNENLDERAVWTAVPTVKLRLSKVDMLSFQGEYSLVEYRTNSLRDSSRAGVASFWTHNLSAKSSMKLAAGTTQIEYPNGNLDDYDAHFATLSYTAETRNLRYTFLAGVNKASFADGDDDYSAPTVEVNLTYASGLQTIEFKASQDITDSSIGNSNQVDVDPSPGNDGVGIDQIERKQLSLSWDTASLCARCSLNVFAQFREDEYRRSIENDNDDSSAGFAFGYRLAEQKALEVRFSRQLQQYKEPGRADLVRDQLGITYFYDFTGALKGALFYSFEMADGDLGSNKYEQNNYGLSLTYGF